MKVTVEVKRRYLPPFEWAVDAHASDGERSWRFETVAPSAVDATVEGLRGLENMLTRQAAFDATPSEAPEAPAPQEQL